MASFDSMVYEALLKKSSEGLITEKQLEILIFLINISVRFPYVSNSIDNKLYNEFNQSK